MVEDSRGNFEGDPNGMGRLTWANGSKFVGNFKKGKRHGKGLFTFPDGRREQGEWVHGLLNVEEVERGGIKTSG